MQVPNTIILCIAIYSHQQLEKGLKRPVSDLRITKVRSGEIIQCHSQVWTENGSSHRHRHSYHFGSCALVCSWRDIDWNSSVFHGSIGDSAFRISICHGLVQSGAIIVSLSWHKYAITRNVSQWSYRHRDCWSQIPAVRWTFHRDILVSRLLLAGGPGLCHKIRDVPTASSHTSCYSAHLILLVSDCIPINDQLTLTAACDTQVPARISSVAAGQGADQWGQSDNWEHRKD